MIRARLERLPTARPAWLAFWLVAGFAVSNAAGSPEQVRAAVGEEVRAQDEASASQDRIDKLDDETQKLLTEYRQVIAEAESFKTYNDQFGHQAGDQVLVGISICISDSARRVEDCAARYGGEEFALLLPGLSAAEATKVAESIRLKVEQWSGDPAVTTVSIGVAWAREHGLTRDDLVKNADDALYRAKEGGRNQVVMAAPPIALADAS